METKAFTNAEYHHPTQVITQQRQWNEGKE